MKDWPTEKLMAMDHALRRAQSLLAILNQNTESRVEKGAIAGAMNEIHEALTFVPPKRRET